MTERVITGGLKEFRYTKDALNEMGKQDGNSREFMKELKFYREHRIKFWWKYRKKKIFMWIIVILILIILMIILLK